MKRRRRRKGSSLRSGRVRSSRARRYGARRMVVNREIKLRRKLGNPGKISMNHSLSPHLILLRRRPHHPKPLRAPNPNPLTKKH